ncbi:hypothetical protein FACS1894187_11540 [Synergistales bacterium]|nr:hypothetical protein FACS1894187_11540 [Synergistales bacterium]
MDKNMLLMEKLKEYDTPSVTNVIATYPGDKELCLGLYNPWTCNWYTDQSIKCMYPELGRTVGYAVTVVYELPDPNFQRLSLGDVLCAIEASPKPCVLVMKQNIPDEIKRKNGLSGGNMTTAFQTLGCVGCISDGPSRDIDEIRPMKFQYMLTGVTAGHGSFGVAAVNVPVSVGGMDVTVGEIIHMDENGAVKFPADKLEIVVEMLDKLSEHEKKKQADIRACKTAKEIIQVMSGGGYVKK